jgi:hypothetical protein
MKVEAVHPSLRSLPPAPFTERVTFFSAFEGLFLKAYANQMTPAIRAS